MIGAVFQNRFSGVYWRCCGYACGSMFLQRVGESGWLVKEFKDVGRIGMLFYKHCPELVMPLTGSLRERYDFE